MTVGGLVMALGLLVALVELPLVVFVLFRRFGFRLWVTATMTIGVALFAASVVVTEKYTASKLPPRQATATLTQ